MALFQKSVLSNYLDSVSDSEIDKGWSSLQSYKEMASKVQSFKEEEFQADFLTIIFADCFGYISNYKSGEEGNLFFEQKNKVGSKKADGTIIKDGEVIAVIELKSTKTKNLNDVKDQAFGYYTNNSKCEYVITSNFNKLRFYIERNEDYLEFDLFNINKEEFKLLWLCLDSTNLLEGKPKEIKNKSIVSEESVTKKLYQDYSLFRLELFNDLVNNNHQHEKGLLLNKTQKLLDRILFILFGEDRGLLPSNSISEIINFWDGKKGFGDDEYLYNTFVTYFDVINKGRQKRGNKNAIYSYNGGLFHEDGVLDTLVISDEVLLKYTKKLTAYDFESEVSVDILGHIFEHSLSEIEELQNQIDGVEIDKSKSKRKKDGIYYTPKYITKYIVDNTLGKLCKKKKIELDINEESYSPKAKRSRNRISSLDEYRSWLLKLTICDPACGSGAFLIQALDFLIKEHHYIDELSASYNKDSIMLSDVKNSILENNLYGVDLNEESVEIAKLSLWLNTAESNRKLTSLNNNIKCGNSLIDDPEVGGDKAFNWQKEFPNIFHNGGFDVVIGNPPYGAKLEKEIQSYLAKKYIKGGSETAISFIKLSYDLLLREKGEFGFITPKSFSFSSNYLSIRRVLLNDINRLIDCKKVWKDVKLEQVLVFFSKSVNSNKFLSGIIKSNQIFELGEIEKVTFEKFGFYLNGISNEELKIGEKTNSNMIYVGDVSENKRGGNFQKNINENDELRVIGGAEIQRDGISKVRGYINTNKTESSWLINENSLLVQNIVAHIENPSDHIKITACYPQDKNYVILDTINQLTFNEKYDAKVFWILFNSKLINWYCYNFILAKAIRTIHFDSPVTNRIPFPESLDQNKFIEIADHKFSLNKKLQGLSKTFIDLLVSDMTLEKVSKKLTKWYDLEWKEFEKELKKLKINLYGIQKEEWYDRFTRLKENIKPLNFNINQTDKQIDQMVYQLYGLTKEEIEIVENS